MILQNYIFKQVSITSINITIIFFSMIWLIQSLRQIDLVIENGASLFDFLYISILPGPLWLMIIIPISSLISVIIIFNRFSNDQETLSFHLSGANIFFLIKPILLMSIFNLILLTVINFYIIPKAYNIFKSKQFELRNNISQIFLREGVFNDIQKDLTVLVDKRVSMYELEGIFIYDTRKINKEIDIFARKGKIVLTSSGPFFQLEDGNRREVQSDGKVLNELSFKNYSINIARKKTDPKFGWYDTNAESIISLLTNGDLNAKAEGHFRLSYPIMAITLPMLSLVIFLCFPMLFKRQVYIVSSSLFLGLLIQLLLISMRKVFILNPSLWSLFYLIPITPILLSLFIIFFQDNFKNYNQNK